METEKDIRRLKKKRQTIVQTNVSGSNPDFPYNPQHFKIAGTAFTYEEDSRLRHEEKILEERRENAQRLKVEVEQWMNHIPQRMQRIIKYRVFEEMSWSQVASKLGGKLTEGSVKWNFKIFEKSNLLRLLHMLRFKML
jgi:DNA-directed RNA polymerase specialized sigma24 family protein